MSAAAPLACASSATVAAQLPAKRAAALGSLRHRDELTGEILLVPTPSQDPNDPLNWSRLRKHYLAFIICLVMMMANFAAAGPAVALVAAAGDFFPGGDLASAISKCAFFFSTTALTMGVANLFWMPLVVKYGRRPVYLASFTLYLITVIWAACSYSYVGTLIARILMGVGAGPAETMAPLSITDVFFLHERGLVTAYYSSALSCGVSFGIIIAGLITINNGWRYIYYVSIGVVGATLVLMFFSFPETAYCRKIKVDSEDERSLGEKPTKPSSAEMSLPDAPGGKPTKPSSAVEMGLPELPAPKTFLQTLNIFSGVYTEESLWRLFVRPLALILLPPVLWGSLVMSVTVGFLVAVVSNVSYAYQTYYGFRPYETGLCFIAAIIGSLVGIFFGGSMGDMMADFFTRRNGGIREPEMRLPAMIVCCITMPLSLILYGVGVENRLHWMLPTVGLALLNFALVQGTNVALVYVIDVYRPIAGEVTLAMMAFKSGFAFLLSFYTNPWIDELGYVNAYGSMAGISVAILFLWVPLYIYGKRIRQATWEWRVTSYAHWHPDREVGE